MQSITPRFFHFSQPCRETVQAPAFPVATKVNGEYTNNMDKMLYTLVVNTSKMTKYMKRVAHCYEKEVKDHKLSQKSKAGEDKAVFINSGRITAEWQYIEEYLVL